MSADGQTILGLTIGALIGLAINALALDPDWHRSPLGRHARLLRLRYTTWRTLRRAARTQRHGARRLDDLDRYADQSRPAHRRSTTE